MKCITLIIILCMSSLARVSPAKVPCHPVTKFWASANKAVATYWKLSGNFITSFIDSGAASLAKTAMVTWKKDSAVKKNKCVPISASDNSLGSASFSSTSANADRADLGSSMAVQTNQNKYWLSTKNKGLDYYDEEVQIVMANCFAVMEAYGAKYNVLLGRAEVVAVQFAINTSINANIWSATPNTYPFKTSKFPVMAQKAGLVFFKINYLKSNKDFYVSSSKVVKATAKAVKLAWKGNAQVTAMSTSDDWGKSVWFAFLDVSSIAVGMKYPGVYYLAEVQTYMINCFNWIYNMTATAAPSDTATLTLITDCRTLILTACLNLGFLVTTEPAFTGTTSTTQPGCCTCPQTTKAHGCIAKVMMSTATSGQITAATTTFGPTSASSLSSSGTLKTSASTEGATTQGPVSTTAANVATTQSTGFSASTSCPTEASIGTTCAETCAPNLC